MTNRDKPTLRAEKPNKQIQTVEQIKKDYFDQWDATEHPSTCDSWQYGVEHCNCFIEAKWKWVEETIAQTQQEAVERERERIWDYIDERLQDEVSKEILTDLAKIIFEALKPNKQIQTVEGLKSRILDIIQTDSNNLEKTEAIRAFDKETEHIWQHWIDQAQKVIEALQNEEKV